MSNDFLKRIAASSWSTKEPEVDKHFCVVCGGQFIPKVSNQVNCSKKCQEKTANDNYKVNHPYITPCHYCGKEAVRHPTNKYNIKSYCDGCLGIETRLAVELGISKQAVNQRVKYWFNTGEYLYRLDALNAVRLSWSGRMSRGSA